MGTVWGQILMISGGAALGANARYWLSVWTATVWGPRFPAGTLIANVSGSVLLGFLLALTATRLGLPEHWRLFLAVGFCGSFTTFSSYAVESVTLFDGHLFDGQLSALGWLNILANNGLALGGALLGIWLARTLF